MNWYDPVVLAKMVLVVAVQTVRGIKAGAGLVMFEAAGVVVAAAAATASAHSFAAQIHAPESSMMLVLFIVFSVVAFFVARWLFALTALSFQWLDPVLSLFLGLVMAWAIAHMFFRIMIGSEGGPAADEIAGSPVAREVFQFRTWNALMRLLFKARTGQETDVDLG